MFNVGGPEILVILLVALVVLGPQELPKAIRTVGRVMGELRRISSGFQAEMQNALDPTAPATPRDQLGNATTMEQADITETVARAELEPEAASTDPAPEGGAEHPVAADATPAAGGDERGPGEPDRFTAPTPLDATNHQVRPIDPIDRAAG